jgi:hypothetical protein
MTLRRNISPPSSGSKGKPSKETKAKTDSDLTIGPRDFIDRTNSSTNFRFLSINMYRDFTKVKTF